jgi:hypothetical protein
MTTLELEKRKLLRLVWACASRAALKARDDKIAKGVKIPNELCGCNGRLATTLSAGAVFFGAWDILDIRIMYIMLNKIITKISSSHRDAKPPTARYRESLQALEMTNVCLGDVESTWRGVFLTHGRTWLPEGPSYSGLKLDTDAPNIRSSDGTFF